ncbi:MAG TPA: hypothetical protein VD758_08900 [Gemmatimonadaceae bacterium]|nr:hypothetical protein [Gemmatimonadaceae bacterium]
MNTTPTSRVLLFALPAMLCGCPADGRGRESDCSVDFDATWHVAEITHFLSQPNDCPIPLQYSGQPVHYAASLEASDANIPFSSIVTVNVYDAASHFEGLASADWYYTTGNTLESDVTLDYDAGKNAPIASGLYDVAYTDTDTNYGEAVATAYLTYRIGAVVAIQGDRSPAPGNNGSWSMSVSNATAPFTYRWFKDGVELAGQTSSSLQLPVSTSYFSLKGIASSNTNGADTLAVQITPAWHVLISGMADRSPSLSCPFTVDTGNNSSSPFTYDWVLDGTMLPDHDWSTNPSFTLGSHSLTVYVSDANGYTTNNSMSINVTQDGPSNCQ